MSDVDRIRAQRVLARLRTVATRLSGYDPADLDEASTFLELGFDSLFLIQLATAFQREYGITITPRQLFDELPTLRALADHIDGQLPAETPVVTPSVPATPTAEPASASLPAGGASQPHSEPSNAPVMPMQAAAWADVDPEPWPVAGADAAQAGVRGVLAQQLALMAQQIQLLRSLRGARPNATATVPAPPDIQAGATAGTSVIAPFAVAPKLAAVGTSAVSPLTNVVPDPVAVDAFVRDLGERGVDLTADQDVLLVSAPKGVVDSALFERIVSRKTAILRYLQAQHEKATADIVRGNRAKPTITPAAGDERLALSFAQQRLWFVAQMGEEASAAYHISLGLRLCGVLDRSALRQALDRLVARHEALRTTFVQVDGEPTQCIAPEAGSCFRLLEHDLTGDEDPASGLTRLVAEEAHAPFDLEHGPLVRGRLIREASEEHTLLITMHHIVSDGWSLRVLMNDLNALYRAYQQGEVDPLPPLAVQYADYAAWQRRWVTGDVLRQQADYWKATLAGAPALLELPTDRARPAGQDYAGAFIDCRLDAGLTRDLKALSRRHGTTLFMTLLASWAALLSRLSGQEEVVIGTPSANRGRSEIEGLIGFFVNTLALRVDVSGSPTVGELLARVRVQALDAQQHQDIPFEQVVELTRPVRSLAYSPLFQVMFAWDSPTAGRLELPGLTVAPSESAPKVTSQFDLGLVLSEEDGHIVGGVEYATALFERATVARYLGHWRTLLAAMVADDGQAIDRLPLLTVAERHQLLEQWNATAAEYPREQCIHELFEAQVLRSPDAVALVHEEQQLSYDELNARANQLAHYLRELGVRPDDRVAICMERSPEMVVGLLAVLKAGGAYVPLDPAYPQDRLAYKLEDSASVAVLTDGGLERVLDTVPAVPVLDLKGPTRPWIDRPQVNPDRNAVGLTTNHLAYVIYTSGSTGKPKGVMVEHGNLSSQITALRNRYGIRAQDRLLQFAPLTFDVAVEEVFVSLLSGAALVLRSDLWLTGAKQFMALCQRHNISVIDLPTRFWQSLFDEQPLDIPACVRLCVIGGEAVDQQGLRAWLQNSSRPRLLNAYGPTEATISALVHEPDIADLSCLSIGRPISNTRVYILDRHGEPVPLGVSGELHIGGTGVARGYLNRAALTAERFVPDPFAGEAGVRMYKTGDLGRWLPDGTVEFLGRNDFQVKLRGFRIELGEIEAQLLECPGVREAVVVAREDVPGDQRLVAYYVPSERGGADADVEGDAAVGAESLRHRLGAKLPEHMLPTAYVRLEALPLTPNGKLDRKALPAPDAGSHAVQEYEAPQGELETAVARIFAELLRVERVGRHDNFFDLGGHSLLGARLLSRVGQALGVRLPVRTLFEATTVARLAEMAEAARVEPTTQEDVPRHADQSSAPLSLMQQRLWVQEQLQPGQATYNIASAYRLCGPLDVHALESALGEVVRRQSTLRTELGLPDEGAMQRVHDHVEVALPLEDLSALMSGHAEHEAMRRMVELSAQPISLGQAPLFRVRLYRLSADEHLLFFIAHHAIWDGRSQELFRTEMAALYEANTGGRPAELPQLTRSYVDFVHWHLNQAAKPEMQTQLAYWKEHLAGDLEPLQLPEDLPRPTLPTGQGGSELVHVDGLALARLRQIGASADASLFMTLLAAYLVWLHRMTSQQDLVVGVPVRSHVSEAMDPVMGFFVNIVPLRVHVDPALSFLRILERVRQAVLDCFSHSDVPLESLVSELGLRRDPSRSPIYQALFSFEETGGCMPRWGALSCEQVFLPQATANNDLSFWCCTDTQGLTATLNYSTDIILAASAERMGRRFEALLASLPTDLDTAVGDVNFLCEEDRNALERWNATTVPLHAPATLHAMLAEQFRATPKFDAIHFGGSMVSYAQLNARSERIAAALAARGVVAGDLVGVCLGRHADLVATLIGVLVAGAAYVPLDPAYPPGRLRFMAEDAGLALVVSEGELAEPLRWPREKLLLLDADATQIESATLPAGLPSVGPDAPAYVIYTSGSTGKPKGVRVPHGAVVNLLRSMRREPGIVPSDRLLAVTTTSFDIAVLELFLPLTVGASVVLASREEVFDGAELARLLTASNATMMQATPSVWRLLLDSGWVGHTNFKALCGGEPLPVDLAEQLCARGFALWNMYGPTETTVWSTCANVRAPMQDEMLDIHIGHPIDNTTVWVLDPRGHPCPPGVSGEIYIGGAGVTLGYHERPELTDERFVPDRFASVAAFADSALPPRLYRTGDRGRWRHDGMLKHEGRLDFQVKLRGHRIEPGEIESCLAACKEIARAVVIVREDRLKDQRLVAYVVARPAARVDELALRTHLRGILPAYMVPQHIVALDALPLLPNGKLDRNALPLPGTGRSAIDLRPEAAVTAIIVDPRVRYLAGVWCELLGTPVGAADNFFDVGGNSMLAVQMANRVAADTGVRIKLVRLASHDLQSIASELPGESEPGTRSGRGAQLVEKAKRMFGAYTR